MRDYVKRLLLSQGYEVEAVADGVAALAVVRQQMPDLVLTDIMMPKLDGLGLLQELRAKPNTREIPIILLSARAGEESRIEGLETGADDYLIKPFSARELLARVEASLKMSQMRQEALRREQELRIQTEAARNQISNILESITDAFVAFDHQWRYTYVNEQATRLLHKTREELLGKQVWDEVFPQEVGNLGYQEFHRAINQQVSVVFEEFSQSLNKWLEVHAYSSPDGIAVYFRDITDRKRVEAERARLLEREQQQTRRLQKLAEASLTINSTLSLNERLQLITELARDLIEAHQSVTSMTIDNNWAQAIHTVSVSDKYAQWHDYHEQPNGYGIYTLVCRTQRPIRMTQAELEAHPAWRNFGQQRDAHPPMRGWLAAPLTSRNGNNLGLIQLSDKYEGEFDAEDEAILVQLAQMASTAIDNARLYEESQRANRIKDEFLAVLSHELRSPLNPILGWSKLLQTHKIDAARTAQALSIIERNAKLQAGLIEDLLDVSRILRGKLSLQICPVDLTSTMQAAMETVRLAAQAKSIDLRFTILDFELGNNQQILEYSATYEQSNHLKPKIQNPKFQVMGDSNRLQQVIWNLLSNAVKFTPQGGQVDIRLEHFGSQAQIVVSDTGKGIPPEFLPYVFDHFRQADAATTRKFGGLGLGLAIVHHLVELHGGTVQAESPGEDQGATFTVRLPLMLTQNQTPQDTPSSSQSLDLNGVKILVVDDDADTREFIAFLLEEYGANVTAVATATEALVSFTQFQPDLLLSDIGMPDIDGYMLMEQVRTLPPEQGGEIPAIALTAYAAEIDHQQALKVGFQRHVSKPVDPVKLVEVITKLIGKD
jgi:PAS domain S-box-containing protein